jgi:hypothetical protein
MTCKMKVLRCWRRMVIAALLGLCSLWAVAYSSPQSESEDGTRRIWKKKFREARAHIRSSPPRRTTVKGELIGVTIWRLHDDQNKLMAERATADTIFNQGDRVRLSIEVPRESDNYLYVIDREVYADGTTSDPYLIFPSQSTPKGGDVVTAGKLVFIPARGDAFPYFTLERARKDQLSEDLTIIVSPKPLKLPMGQPTAPFRLEREQVAEWERQWGARVEHWEEQGGAGKQCTAAEKESDGGERRLVQGDPLPQTIYLIKAKPGAPMALRVSLRVAS